MKAKIISALKTHYANRGFGDKAFDGVAEYISKTVTEETQIEDAVKGVDGLLKAFQGEVDKVRGEKATIQKELDELKAKGEPGGDPKPQPKQDGDDTAALVAAEVAKAVQPFKEENAAYKAKEATSARTKLITDKAKELGLPDFMIKHGFVIPEDADETAISATLSAIKQDYVTASLESGNRFPIVSDQKATKEEVDAIVKNMV